jgi:hypothetical protein
MLYLDPGSGSFLLQLLIAGAAGVAIAIGAQWTKIKRLFRRKRDRKEETEDDEDE